MGEKREFDFMRGVREATLVRQGGLCAACKRAVGPSDPAHHVIPQQCGRSNPTLARFLRTAENCVKLCPPCHERYHESGRYRDGAVAEPKHFPWSHGVVGKAGHAPWCAKILQHWAGIAKVADARRRAGV